MAFISYAQNFEDVFLDRCFGSRNNGLYIDVGASAPVRDSVTFGLYLKGWSGVNIEPIPERALELRRLRPRDITREVAAGAQAGRAMLKRTDGLGGLSSLDERPLAALRATNIAIDEFEVDVITLGELCAELGIAELQLLKVDVEGFEGQVLKGFDFGRCRPELILVESIDPLTRQPSDADWKPALLTEGYIFAYDDGLNAYFVRQESSELLPAFQRPVSILDEAVSIQSFDGPLIDRRHPDHGWANRIAGLLIRNAATLSEENLLSIFCGDAAKAALDEPLNLPSINRAYVTVLDRPASHEEAEDILLRVEQQKLSMRTLIYELLFSFEFKARLARTSGSISL